MKSRGAPGIEAPWNLPIAAALCGVWLLLSLSRLLFEVWPGSTAWYPPAALVAAACIVWGWRPLIPLLAGGLISALLKDTGEPLWQVMLLSLAVKASYWLGSVALRALRFDPSFGRPADVARFTLVMSAASLVNAACSVSYGVATNQLARADSPNAVIVFWMGDLMAVLALTPMLLAGARLFDRRRAPAEGKPLRVLLDQQTVLQLLSLPVTLLFAFLAAPRIGVLAFSLGFIPLGWIAITHGVTGATVMSALLDVGAVVTHEWTAKSIDNLELQALIGSLAITALLLGSVAGEREGARAQLAESEERYRALVELLPDPLLVSRDGRVLYANPAAARTLGAASPEAMLGKQLLDMAAPESRERIRQRLTLLGSGQAVALVEHKMVKQDGSGTVQVESISIPINFGGGRAALTVARDVTTSRRLAEELRHAQRLESVGQLAGGVAHDFNNLLSVIMSCSEVLQDQLPAGGVQHELARETMDAAKRGAALTRQLLTFSRKQPVQERLVRLDEVVRGTELLLRRLIGSAVNVRLNARETGAVLADPGEVEQVVINLAVNARDAMSGGGDLSIETGAVRIAGNEPRWPGLPPGEYATLFIRDTGHGMTPEIRAHIFEPFFTTKEAGKGTGLGLATVYGIVRRAKGSIFVESEPGEGTLFAIFLPRVETPLTADLTAHV